MKTTSSITVALTVLSAAAGASVAQTPAFPGAEGYGAQASSLLIWLEKDRHLKIKAMAVKQLYVLRAGLRTIDFGITRRFGQLGHIWVIAELAIAQGVRQTG